MQPHPERFATRPPGPQEATPLTSISETELRRAFAILVTINIVSANQLTVAPAAPATSLSLSYTKTTGAAASVGLAVSSAVVGNTTPFFLVNQSSLPAWLTTTLQTGALAPKTVIFNTTTLTESLAPGIYTAVIYLQVSGWQDTPVTLKLQVTNKAPSLSITTAAGSGATTVNIPYVWGSTTPPTTTVTALSTDSPISYVITSGGPLMPTVSAAQSSGLAYSFGSNIIVTFNPAVYQAAQPGTTISGTLTFTYGSPASVIVVTINLKVLSAAATLSSIYPASLPTASAGSSTVTLLGSGFVAGQTRVGIVVNGILTTDSNLSSVVNGPGNITLTITVPTSPDCPNLPFSPSVPCAPSIVVGGPVFLGVVNGTGTTPTGFATLQIGSQPIIQVNYQLVFIHPGDSPRASDFCGVRHHQYFRRQFLRGRKPRDLYDQLLQLHNPGE